MFSSVVVGRGPQSMLGRVVGSRSVVTNLRAVRISRNDKFLLQKRRKSVNLAINLISFLRYVTVSAHRPTHLTLKTLVLHGDRSNRWSSMDRKPVQPKLLHVITTSIHRIHKWRTPGKKLALGIEKRRFRKDKKNSLPASTSSQKDYLADKLLTASFSDRWVYSERERSSFSWFVSCSSPKCKVDNHGNKSVRFFLFPKDSTFERNG